MKSEFFGLYHLIIVSLTHHIPETGMGKPNGCNLPPVGVGRVLKKSQGYQNHECKVSNWRQGRPECPLGPRDGEALKD